MKTQNPDFAPSVPSLCLPRKPGITPDGLVLVLCLSLFLASLVMTPAA